MITIIGASKGLGKLFHEYLLSAEYDKEYPLYLVSREDGINLNDDKEYKHVIELCADSQIVFNNAPANMQLDIVYDTIYNTSHVSPKDWVHVGSQMTDVIKDAKAEGMEYISNKQLYADFIRGEINKFGVHSVKHESLQRHCLLSLGAVETNQIDDMFKRLGIEMIDRAYMYRLWDFIFDTPQDYCLGEIRLVPDQYINPDCNDDFEFRRHLKKYQK